MRTRRDQVQAYRFVTRRTVSALLSGDPETTDLPMRRLGLAVFGSAMVAAIVLAGAGVYGLMTKRSAPLEANTLVIEKETGATYVFVDGRLYPTLNYTSARLIIGDAAPPVRSMSQASIRERPRGRMVGIVGAPDDLPDRSSLVGLPWSVCNTPDPDDPRRSTTRLVLNQRLSGGTPLGDQAILVSVNGQRHLLSRNTRMQILGGDAAIAALKMASVRPIEVGQQLINAVPAGPRLREPFVAGDKEPSELQVGNGPAWVGQIFRAADQHYVLTKDGLVPIGEITALLLRRDGGGVKDITPEQAGRVLSDERLEEEGVPQKLPELRQAGPGRATVCATYQAGSADGPPTTSIEVFDRTPPELSPTAPGSIEVRQTERDTVSTAERVVVPGGKGALVRAMSGVGEGGQGAAASTVYLITSQGIRYPLGSRSGDAVTALGYGGVTPLAVPASLLALIPTGPALERDAARNYFDPGKPSAARSGQPTPSGSPRPEQSDEPERENEASTRPGTDGSSPSPGNEPDEESSEEPGEGPSNGPGNG
ncbi:type VII secretion protein EccB [Micromonospora pallida]|uniref:Type VII secretion protein EccB n=1 Tax=Micromonospora pallida TaxID=145854 RepID=A0A1C6T1Q1_9ACTN|nr:type VII secretion protein EccB [Micromonospora pallida]SCL35740.1 type VII secretion protein EccB [Micromonospora pallida]